MRAMGTFFTDVQIASPRRADRRETVKLLVDSGSLYTWISACVLRDLDVQPSDRRRVVTIEGRTTERGMAEILITLEGRTLQRRLIPAIVYGAATAAPSPR